MKFCNLASGSHGNCSILDADDTCIMIDCGLPLAEVLRRMDFVGINPSRVSAIFLTHEHRDHISGVVAFCHKFGALLFVHSKVLLRFGYMFEKIKSQIRVFDFSDFYYGSITVSPFPLSHDSVCCSGFAFYQMGKKVCLATDTGFVSQLALDAMRQSDLMFLESNHDTRMLIYGPYDARLKKRIASEEGHLSNDQAASVAVSLAKEGTKHFILAHLSEKNNLPQKAFQTVSDALNAEGLVCEIDLAMQDKPTKIFEV